VIIEEQNMSTTPIPYPPGPANSRRVLLDIQKNPAKFLLGLQRAFGNFVHYKHGPVHVYLVNDPDLIRTVLVDKADQMNRPDVARNSYGTFLGNGLVVSAGELHQRQRRAIQPLFTPTQIAGYAERMVDGTNELLDTWHDGETRNIAEDMTTLTMNIMYRTIFGAQPGKLRDELRSAVTTLVRYSGEMLKRTPHADEECRIANERFDRAYAELIALPHTTEKQDLLSHLRNTNLPETGQPMDPKQIRDEVATFFVAGHETTANALTWTWYLIAQHPGVEARLRAELDSVLGSRQPTVDDLASLPFTTQVIKESLRLYPPAWIIGRSPYETIELGGYPVEAKATLVISPYVLHRNSDVFANPEDFNPDRFSTEPPKYTYLPFGAGPHACIGQSFAMQEIALVLATMMQKYRIELVPGQQIEAEPLITLRPNGEVKAVVNSVLEKDY
jgi:cytochrome P450